MARRIGVGVDFGTSNSTVALFDGERMELVTLDSPSLLARGTAASSAEGSIMPTATYIDRDYHTKVGQAAIDQYVAVNMGRRVELVAEVVGKTLFAAGEGAENTRDAPDTFEQEVYGQPVDVGLQGRLFRGVKRLLGDPTVRRLVVFDHLYRLVALITPVLLHMRQETERHLGHEVHAPHVGHPVNYEGRDEHKNKLALTRLGEACGYAGFNEQRFYPEPIAATLSYLHAGGAGDLVLTVDFGGGTLDLCVLRRRAQQFEVLATHGVAIGGDHIDQRLFGELLFPLLGKGERWIRRGHDREVIDTIFPFADYEPMLLNWAVTYLLNQNRYTTAVMDCIEQGGEAAIKFRRLDDLIRHNYGYLLFQRIRDIKAELSSVDETILDIPELDVRVSVTRAQFEHIISDLLAKVAEATDEVVRRAGVMHGDVERVIRTGGSSLIPAVVQLLEERFPGRVVEHDPFTSVARGLAIANFHSYRFP